jgi:4-hydroxy-3-methylbut-2-enyl diphosphate reductase
MKDTIELGKIITGELPLSEFERYFEGKYSANFNPAIHLQKFGVVNQTTQLATDTQAISDYLKQIITEKYGLATLAEHFADTRDTLCYATNDNQSAVVGLLNVPADIAIVMGGKNSSNSSHLVELCEQKLPTFFIDDVNKILSATEIISTDWRTKKENTLHNFLPNKPNINILITSGASCPDTVVEAVIHKIASFYEIEGYFDCLVEKWETLMD